MSIPLTQYEELCHEIRTDLRTREDKRPTTLSLSPDAWRAIRIFALPNELTIREYSQEFLGYRMKLDTSLKTTYTVQSC